MSAIKVMINGKPRELPHQMNLRELVLFLNLMPERAIIELNEAVVPKNRWTETVLAENDCLELVSLVGGG